MGSLAQARTLGGIGSILGILTIVPWVGFLLGIVGLILVLMAVKYIADAVEDKSIFSNMLIAVVLAIVGLFVGAMALLVGVFSLFDVPGLIQGMPLPEPDVPRILWMLVVPLTVTWMFLVVSALFRKRSLDSIAASLNVAHFSTAAIMYLIGYALTIVLVGFLIIFLADIIQIIAFFSIAEKTAPEKTPQPQQQPPQPQQPPSL